MIAESYLAENIAGRSVFTFCAEERKKQEKKGGQERDMIENLSGRQVCKGRVGGDDAQL